TLEGIAQKKGRLVEDHGLAHIFIRPGFTFRVIDGLITNFHLPGSTPLLLVAAFAGMDLMRQAYDEAIRLKYRFYSYGDAMLIL
ncbi:MAG: S-adenosylmethionine:tRNA ribosyltransferase-isomerase, partial [Deltaproteobacteria bacterium]|nr:S-adenosylmethionine:tRNA ribosyltransferase-isomerase [Deltaproteobacteria bacterium]